MSLREDAGEFGTLGDAVNSVRDDATPETWTYVRYTGKTTYQVAGMGSSGLAGLVEALPEEGVTYALLRLDFELGFSLRTVKFVLVVWLGEGISVMTRARVGLHVTELSELMGHTHLTLRSDSADLTPETILRALNIADGNMETGPMFGRLAAAVFLDDAAVPDTHGAVSFVDYAGAEAAKKEAARIKATMLESVEDIAERHAQAFASLFFVDSDAIVTRFLYPNFGGDAQVYAVDRITLVSDTVHDLFTLLTASTYLRAVDELESLRISRGKEDEDEDGDGASASTAAAEGGEDGQTLSVREKELVALRDRMAEIFADASGQSIHISFAERRLGEEGIASSSPKSDVEKAAVAETNTSLAKAVATAAASNTPISALPEEQASQLLSKSIGWQTHISSLRVRPDIDLDAFLPSEREDPRLTLMYAYRHLKRVDAYLAQDGSGFCLRLH